MWKRLNEESLRKNSSYLILLVAIFVYALSLIVPFHVLSINNVRLDSAIDPEVINGILTVSGILFGLSSIQVKKRFLERLLVLVGMFTVQLCLFIIAGTTYFMSILKLGWATAGTMAWALSSLLVNAFSWFLYRLLMIYWGEEKIE